MTHKERKQRRAKIAKRIKAGASTADVAKEFNVGITVVRNACDEYGILVRLSLVRSRERRAKILSAIRQGEDSRKIARRFNMSAGYIEKIGREASATVSFRRKQPEAHRSFRMIAMLQAGKTQSQIGRKLDVSRQRVEQVSKAAKKAGIKFPDSC